MKSDDQSSFQLKNQSSNSAAKLDLQQIQC